jgi:hypothetical protein
VDAAFGPGQIHSYDTGGTDGTATIARAIVEQLTRPAIAE